SPIEIYTDKDSIVLKKYYPMREFGKSAEKVAETLSKFTGHEVLISDENVFVASYGKLAKKYRSKEISDPIKNLIKENKTLSACFSDGRETLPITKDEKAYFNQLFLPIRTDGKAIGMIILLEEEKEERISEEDLRFAAICAEFIAASV
ncbi:MAG: hypothetical protein J5836_03390, partial [Clostridia bacterium]|nr:hypothetical protein [Clostridia bacterium]